MAVQEPDVYYKKSEDGTILFYADNPSYSPYQVEISFDVLENLEVSVPLPYFFVVEPREKQKFLFKAIPSGSNIRLKYSFNYLRGDPNAPGPDDYVYLFPFEHGLKRRIDQGYLGEFSHSNLYALDFHMKEGENVYAARGGIVVDVREDSQLGGPHPSYEKHGNKVIILHEDGTFGEYAHLKYQGALVETGDQVSAGQLIAHSGNTGFSSGPHLHFMVYRAGRLQLESVPVLFRKHDGSAVTPKTGKYYYALHPGKEAFATVSEDELDMTSIAEQARPAKATGEFAITQERVDNAILLYAENGTSQAVRGTLHLTLTNLVAGQELPLRFDVPAKTRQFILKLTPEDPLKNSGFNMKYEF